MAQKDCLLAQVQNLSSRLKEAYRDFLSIYQLSKAFIASRNLDEIMDRLMEVANEIFPFSSCALLLREVYSDDYYIQSTRQISRLQEHMIWRHQREGYFQWAVREQKVILLPNVPEKNKDVEALTSVIVPLFKGSETIGILEIFVNLSAQSLTQKQMDLLSLLADQAAIAIRNAQLYQEMFLKTEVISSMKNYLTGILDHMADGLFALDMEDRITLFNRAAEKILGISSISAIGNAYQNIFTRPFADLLERLLNQVLQRNALAAQTGRAPRPKGGGSSLSAGAGGQALAGYDLGGQALAGQALGGQAIAEEEIEYSRHDRIVFPLSLRVSILGDESQNPMGFIVLCQDISELKELRTLRKLDHLKEEFVSSVSHELRTPLTAIKSFTEILLNLERDDPESQREFLQIIDRETNRLINIIENVLTFSETQDSQREWPIEATDLRQVIQEACRVVGEALQEKQLVIRILVAEELPRVLGNSKLLGQVMRNLLENAVKFTPKGGQITIEACCLEGRRFSDPPYLVRVAVRDTGIGIPREVQQLIFEKFKQLGDPAQGKPQGTGLGLAICKNIVERFNGNIWVESQVGKGSTFYFTLPAVSEDD